MKKGLVDEKGLSAQKNRWEMNFWIAVVYECDWLYSTNANVIKVTQFKAEKKISRTSYVTREALTSISGDEEKWHKYLKQLQTMRMCGGAGYGTTPRIW